MRFLLDTCTFLWICRGGGGLSGLATAQISDPGNNLYFSAISAWEIVLKVSLGKLRLPVPPRPFILEECSRHQIDQLPFRIEDAFPLFDLPAIHKDPFDRMLVCQALTESLTILTPDPRIVQYPVPTLW